MHVPGIVYVNDRLQGLLFEELQAACQRDDHGGFLPAVKQIANVAALPGIVSVRSSKSFIAAYLISTKPCLSKVLDVFQILNSLKDANNFFTFVSYLSYFRAALCSTP